MQRERVLQSKGNDTLRGARRSFAGMCTRLMLLGTLGCGRLGAGDADTMRPGFLPTGTPVDAVLPREICFDAIQPGDTVSVLLQPGQFQTRGGIRDEEWPRRFAMRLRWARVEGLGEPALVPFSGDVNGAPIDPTVVTFFLPDLSRELTPWGPAKPSACEAAGRWLPGQVLQHGLAWTGPSVADSMPASP